MKIEVDVRERSSGLIELLIAGGAAVDIKTLKNGDYVIDSKVTVERKSDRDFLVSIIDGRLFRQIAALKRYTKIPLLMIEGNPFRIDMKIDRRAIIGAMVNIQAVWSVPILFSRTLDETVSYFELISRQHQKHIDVLRQRKVCRPRRLINRQLYLIQGLPQIGPKLAKRLLVRFGSVIKIMNAGIDELTAVEGVGLKSANRIRDLLDAEFCIEQNITDQRKGR